MLRNNALAAIFALDLLHSRYIWDVDSWPLLYQKGLKYIADKGIYHLLMDLIIHEIIKQYIHIIYIYYAMNTNITYIYNS